MNNPGNIERTLENEGRIIYPNRGKSMLPLIREGKDLMVIEKRPPGRLKRYDAVLFRRKNLYVLHRIMKIEQNGYTMCGDNQWYLEKGVRDEDVIGILTGVIRNGKKTVSVNQLSYRIYVTLWCRLFPIRVLYLRVKFKILSMIKHPSSK